jgi:competence ComEA-like helix-hairpin-helix protein
MIALTPAERRGALVVMALLTLGTLRDLWTVWRHPPTRSLSTGQPWRATPDVSEPSSTRAMTPSEAPGPSGGAPASALPSPIDLNHADERALDALPGIGPVLAGRIVAHRNRFGPFRQPEDLLAVPGIGPRLFTRLRSRIVVSAVTSPSGAPRADAKRTASGDGRVQISLQSRPGTDR